eukprot:m.16366 g.16366  ORF g.16366 m.16366 type:complete len:199 (+) comp26871_c0_seq4:996-1592(+)
MDGSLLDGLSIYVGRAQKKAERKAEVADCGTHAQSSNLTNLYVKNLPRWINADNKLHELFERFGNITSVKVVLTQGRPTGAGFVNFSSSGEAALAMETMHNHAFGGKPLYVNFHQSKEERSAKFSGRDTPEDLLLRPDQLSQQWLANSGCRSRPTSLEELIGSFRVNCVWNNCSGGSRNELRWRESAKMFYDHAHSFL